MDTIWLIRHAEKPDGEHRGVESDGTVDDESLTVRGWQRAGAWAVWLSSPTTVPDRLYAAARESHRHNDGNNVGSKSKRPLQTVTPLAARIGDVNVTYSKGQESALVGELKQLSGVTLVAWQHELIPSIAAEILGGANGVPAKWPGKRFDVVWRFRRASTSASFALDQLCPCLLGGDLAAPITGEEQE